MTDVVDSSAYSRVKSTSPSNTQPSSPTEQTTQSVIQEKAGEQNVFTIAKLLDTNRPSTQSLSLGETSTLIAMREKIDERLRHSESTPEPRLLAQTQMPPAFVNQLQLWNLLQMMNPGGINFGSTSKTDQSDQEKSIAANFNFQQQQLQEHQRNLLHPLVGVSGNSSNNSDLSRVSRESSRSPVGSNLSDGEHNGEEDFGLNPDGGIRKKKTRTVFSRSQVSQLEAAFNAHRYLNSAQRSQLSLTLGLTETQTKIWFQNRRNKWKRLANGEELNTSNVRPASNGPISNNLSSNTSNSFGNDAFRMFLQSQSSQFNPAHFIGQTGLTLPQLPIFGLTQPTRSDSSENAESPIVNNAQNGFEFARLFAANFLNNQVTKQEIGKKPNLINNSDRNSTNGTPNRLNESTE